MLILLQINRQRLDPRPILHRLGHVRRELAARHALTLRATELQRLMLGHLWPARRQIHHLAALAPHHCGTRQARLTLWASAGAMGHDRIGLLGLRQGYAWMADLPTALFAIALAPAAPRRQFGWSITGRRLVTVV